MTYRSETSSKIVGTNYSDTSAFPDNIHRDAGPPFPIAAVPKPRPSAVTVIIIDSRALDRECLAKGLLANDGDTSVFSFSNIEQWRKAVELHGRASAILLSLGSRNYDDPNVEFDITGLSEEFKGIPVIAIGDVDNLIHIMKVLEYGARGYIPTSVGLDVAVEAVHLARAGGVFVPVSSLLSIHKRMTAEAAAPAPDLSTLFTARQAAVVDALRRGKANKIIAYELNLCESTVKVHIRNIMKKLKAKNRTEVAFKINDLFPRDAATAQHDS
ncbi:LuxR C-terminal-related transcriptional regulator [Inquilinus sp.]|jgi:DNA-binding NarL/FixJ family response regulator|uniref:response regulator transcription factor n=1 Tax=Inquilinus sp. TaxID=1932117 RepID=UPI0037848939